MPPAPRPLHCARAWPSLTPDGSGRRAQVDYSGLEDFLGLVDQPNIPGTVDEHPNWRRRLPVPLEQIASTIDIAALKAATRERSRA